MLNILRSLTAIDRSIYRRVCSLLAGVIFLLCLYHGIVLGQAGMPGTVLSNEGQREFEKGMIAAQGRLWTQAIQSFARARADAPVNPDALYNLGSGLPGR